MLKARDLKQRRVHERYVETTYRNIEGSGSLTTVARSSGTLSS
jgi:hypothetical protein